MSQTTVLIDAFHQLKRFERLAYALGHADDIVTYTVANIVDEIQNKDDALTNIDNTVDDIASGNWGVMCDDALIEEQCKLGYTASMEELQFQFDYSQAYLELAIHIFHTVQVYGLYDKDGLLTHFTDLETPLLANKDIVLKPSY